MIEQIENVQALTEQLGALIDVFGNYFVNGEKQILPQEIPNMEKLLSLMLDLATEANERLNQFVVAYRA